MYQFNHVFLSRLFALFVCAMLAGMSTGCAKKTVTPKPMASTDSAQTRTVRFSSPIIVQEGYQVTDPTDPEQMIKKGIALSEAGRHVFAADYFVEVAARVEAPDNKLTTSALFAAANEYLMAGDMDQFADIMDRLDTLLTSFDRSHLGSRETTLLAIYDAVQGRSYVSGVHPDSTREIFNALGN
jgi:hypothetical protein